MNMSYCRFQNTLYAMRECISHIEDDEDTSDMEIKNAKYLYEACKKFIDKCDNYGIRKDYDEGYVFFGND